MIDGNHIIGHTNQEVYEMYSFCAKEIGIPLLSPIDLSRTLCKYYGFELLSKKVNGKTKRCYKQKSPKVESSERSLKCAMHYISNELTPGDVLGCVNSDVYDQYVDWCKDNLHSTCSNVTFSRFICSILDVTVKSIKKDGVTVRIYVEKAGVDHGDDSSSQKGLG